MTFVDGGVQALQVLEREPFDVVVSDMRMPGMDGVALLREVHRRYPETVRLVLSGYADPTSVSSVMEVAHRYLMKPCDPADLVEAIDLAAA